MKEILPFRPYSHLLLILLVGGLAYSNSFNAPFILDDLTSIVGNPGITDLANFAPGGSGYDFIARRWVAYFTFAVNYHFGGLEVWGYHLLNLLIHLGTAALVYALAVLSFRTPHLAETRLARQDGTIALLAALLFVAHPIQTQAVTYIVQRLSSLATFFYLAALVLYITARLIAEKRLADLAAHSATAPKKARGKNEQSESSNWRCGLLLAASTTAAVLAMYTKEIAFTLPLAAVLYEWCFFRGAWPRRLLFLMPLLVTMLIIPVGILTGVDSSPGTALGEQLRAHSDIGRLDYLTTQFRVLVTYLRLLILPINQNLDYDYPLFTSIFNPQILGSLLLLSVLLGLAVFLHSSSRRTDSPESSPLLNLPPELRLVSFGIFWFFLALTVESSLVPIRDLIFEHRLYLPSIGIALAAAVLVGLTSEKTAGFFRGRLPLLLAALIVVTLAVATWERNQVWSSTLSIWEDTVRKSPNKERPWYNLGSLYDDEGRHDDAIQALVRAISIDPKHGEAWHNLGRTYLLIGQNQQAVHVLRNAVRLNPEMDNAVVNLAIALLRTGQAGEAVGLLESRFSRLSGWPQARLNLGSAYLGVGNLAGAQRELAALEQMDPEAAAELRNIINLVMGGSAAEKE